MVKMTNKIAPKAFWWSSKTTYCLLPMNMYEGSMTVARCAVGVTMGSGGSGAASQSAPRAHSCCHGDGQVDR